MNPPLRHRAASLVLAAPFLQAVPGIAGDAAAASASTSAASGPASVASIPASKPGAATRARSAAAGSFVENDGEDCEPRALPPPPASGLPDPFARADGTRMATRADWRCQRQATLRALEAQVYGWKGPKPDRVTGTVSADRIEVTVAWHGREESFSAAVHLPEGPGPHPVMVVVGGVAGVDHALLDSEGVARIDYPNTEVGAETGSGRAKEGAFFRLYGDEVRSSGTLIAWAWGVSRIIDVIAASDQALLRADAVAVTGCSRYGKGALAAGAFDQRVALTIPIESGAGGVPLWRGVALGNGAQPPQSAFGEQPWLGDAFGAFADSVDRLATDQHQVLGLVAPRGLLILDNPHVDWLGARHGHASAVAGAEVYEALGAAGNIGYLSRVQDPKHCAWRPEWDDAARDAIRRHLHHAPASDLPFTAPAGDEGGALHGWQWDTPELR
jgi:hypothetical protein